jgi:hypothetical protein
VSEAERPPANIRDGAPMGWALSCRLLLSARTRLALPTAGDHRTTIGSRELGRCSHRLGEGNRRVQRWLTQALSRRLQKSPELSFRGFPFGLAWLRVNRRSSAPAPEGANGLSLERLMGQFSDLKWGTKRGGPWQDPSRKWKRLSEIGGYCSRLMDAEEILIAKCSAWLRGR